MRTIKTLLWLFAGIIALIVLLIVLGHSARGNVTPASNEMIIVPFSNSNVVNDPVLAVQMILEDAGFSHITVVSENGQRDGTDIVKKVTIDGSETFQQGDVFQASALIEIICKKSER